MTSGPADRRRLRRVQLPAAVAAVAAVVAMIAGGVAVVTTGDGAERVVRAGGSGFWDGEIAVPTSAPPTTSTTSAPAPPTSVPAPTTIVPATTPPSPTTTVAPPPGPAVWAAPDDCVGLYDVDIDTATARRLVAERVHQPSWSPDGSKLVFQGADADGDSRRESLVVTNADGTDERTIREEDGAEYDALQWDPGGTHVWAIETFENGDGPRPDQLVRIDAGTGAVEAIRPSGAVDDAYLSDAAVSPTGNRVAYGENHVTIRVMDVDGSAVVELARDVRWLGPFVWSPDGETVAAFLYEPDPGIFLYAADGSSSRRLVDTGGDVVTMGGWSADGQLFAFSRIAGGGAVEVVNRDGGDHRVLAGGGAPKWSPDAEWLAFAARSGRGNDEGTQETQETHLIRPDGSDQRVVIDGAAFDVWSPDSRRLLVSCGRSDVGG